MHWKAAQKVVKGMLQTANRSMRLNDIQANSNYGVLSPEEIDKALASLLKSNEIVYRRGWYSLAKKE